MISSDRKSVAEISAIRELKEHTVYNHLAKAIELGVMSLEKVADAAAISDISAAWHQLPEAERKGTKPLFALLEGRHPYGLLFCYLSALKRNSITDSNANGPYKP